MDEIRNSHVHVARLHEKESRLKYDSSEALKMLIEIVSDMDLNCFRYGRDKCEVRIRKLTLRGDLY